MVGGYNLMRDDTALLERHEKSPPSFSVQLYPQDWSLNDSSKRFPYSSQISSILDDIRAFRIPTDFIDLFDEFGVPYYDGCLIVEILDYRPAKAKDPILTHPGRQRVVLRPTPETVWQDICLMNAKTGAKWTDADALEVEAKILLATSNPLCLDPDPNLTRVINSILRVSTPNVPSSLRRKAAAMDAEEDESEKIKRAKIMQFMSPQTAPTRKPIQRDFKILALRERQRLGQLPPPQPRQQLTVAPTQEQNGATTAAPGLSVGGNSAQENGTQDTAPRAASPAQAPPPTTNPILAPLANALLQPIPVQMPPAHIPQHLQPVADPSKRLSPVKQQHSNTPTPRPPSQPMAGPSNLNQQQNIALAMQAQALAQAAQHKAQATQQQQQQQQQQSHLQQQQGAGLGVGLSPSFSLRQPPARRKSIATKPGGTPATQSQPLPQGTPHTQHAQLQPHQMQKISAQMPTQSTMGMQQPQPQPQQQMPVRPQSQNQPRPQSQPQQQHSPAPTPQQQQHEINQPQQQTNQLQQQQQSVGQQILPGAIPMTAQNVYMRATAAAQASGMGLIPNAAASLAAQRALQSRTGTPANNNNSSNNNGSGGSPGPSSSSSAAAAMTRSPMPPSAKISGRSGTPLMNNQTPAQQQAAAAAGMTPNMQPQAMQMPMTMPAQGQMQGMPQQQQQQAFAARQAAYQQYMMQLQAQARANQAGHMRPPTAAGQHPQMQVSMQANPQAGNIQQKQEHNGPAQQQQQHQQQQQQFAPGVPVQHQPMYMPMNMNMNMTAQQQQQVMMQWMMRQQMQRGVPPAQAQAQAQAQMQMQLQNGQMPNMTAAMMAYQQQQMGRGNGAGNRQ